MTGDIQSKLLASQAAISLAMEDEVAQAFRSCGWPANQGMYYTDVDTTKIREIDVHAHKTFARKRDGLHTALANFHIFSECKYLRGQHVLFSPGDGSRYWGVDRFWLGDPSKEALLQETVVKSLNISDANAQAELYDYVGERSHPDSSALLTQALHITPPVVECVARGFRETNLSAVKDEDSSVIWRAVQSLRSAVEAARKRGLDASISNISFVTKMGNPPGSAKLIADVATAVDFELVRVLFFHMVMFTHAGLWSLDKGTLSKVNSVRLIISNIDFIDTYVDIVSADHVAHYVKAVTKYFDHEVGLRLTKARKSIDKMGWYPGQLRRGLEKIALESRGPTRRSRRRVTQ